MPKSVTTVNLDFDEKEEFIRKFGKAELSAFIRQCIHKRLQEKNREASSKDLSPISRVKRYESNSIMFEVGEKDLDGWIRYARQLTDPETLIEMHPKTSLLEKLIDGKIKAVKTLRRVYSR